MLAAAMKEQGRQRRLFRYLLTANQSPHFFQPVAMTRQEHAQQADRAFTASL
jgi:hypothetical protein